MSSLHIASRPVPYTNSFRITFVAEPGKVEVASVARVAMRALASLPPPSGESHSGFWFELRGDKGDLLYHRPIRDPLPDSVEVFDDPQGGTIRRVPTTRTRAKFDVIAPDLPGAAEFTLHGPAGGGPEARRRPSGVLIRRSMDELRKAAAAGEGAKGRDER